MAKRTQGLLGKWLLAFYLGVMLFLFGCASSSPPENQSASNVAGEGMHSNALHKTASVADQAQESPAASEAQPSAAASNPTFSNATASPSGVGQPPVHDRKMIYQADLQLEVENYKESRTNIEKLVTRSHGYILSSSDYVNDDEKGSHLTVRIPQDGFSSFLTELDKYAIKIPSRNINGQDVTEEYVDLTSRLKALQVVEARLLTFMSDAKKTEDLLKISTELGNVQQEIEKIKGRMRYLDENISYSTVELSIVEKKFTAKLNEVADQGTWHKAWIALNQSLLGILSFLNGLIVVIAALLPILVVLAIVLIPGYLYWKRKKQS